MTVTSAPATEEEQTRAVIADRAAAIHDRDAGRFVAHYAPQIVKFDHPPRWSTAGRKPATRRRCAPGSPATRAGLSTTRSAT